MTLKRAVATPFLSRGTDRLPESEFVVTLSLERGWFAPDRANRLLDLAEREGLVRRTEDELEPTFDLASVSIPEDFEPEDGLLEETSTVDRIFETLVAADLDKQRTVAAANRLQTDLDISLPAAALLFGHREGVDVTALAGRARADLEAESNPSADRET